MGTRPAHDEEVHQNRDHEPHCHGRDDLLGWRTVMVALLLLTFVRFASLLSFLSFCLLSLFSGPVPPSASVRQLFRPQAQDDLFCSS